MHYLVFIVVPEAQFYSDLFDGWIYDQLSAYDEEESNECEKLYDGYTIGGRFHPVFESCTDDCTEKDCRKCNAITIENLLNSDFVPKYLIDEGILWKTTESILSVLAKKNPNDLVVGVDCHI